MESGASHQRSKPTKQMLPFPSLPPELNTEILSRLPVNSLLKIRILLNHTPTLGELTLRNFRGCVLLTGIFQGCNLGLCFGEKLRKLSIHRVLAKNSYMFASAPCIIVKVDINTLLRTELRSV
ncbi:hypothetical protein HAX54_048719 [Datura stramonium]|uniref:F-box domain-containing protein n=1 Tax=Datura stramonium TaxID=4076 RepID=A0ABS8SVR5_DATST|nr:hypothetical protein [Datura stramonium]